MAKSEDQADEQARVYEMRAEDYDALISAEDADGELATMLREIVPPRDAVIVDVGAGTGRSARIVGAAVRHVHLVDRAKAMLEVARRQLVARGDVSFTIHEADARALPLSDASCDVAIAGWVFGHFRHWMPDGWRDEVATALAEMHRVVRAGGTLVVIETLGTGHETPRHHPALDEYVAYLEHEAGFTRHEIRTDYAFTDAETAATICGGFFGNALADRIRTEQWSRVPECTAVFITSRPPLDDRA